MQTLIKMISTLRIRIVGRITPAISYGIFFHRLQVHDAIEWPTFGLAISHCSRYHGRFMKTLFECYSARKTRLVRVKVANVR